MATKSYMDGRKKYARPQAMLWSDSAPTLVYKDPSNTSLGSMYVPAGYEEYSDLTNITSTDRFLILSDHNRSEIDVSNQRIEQRQRMVNGTMRSYHIADKLTLNTSWSLLPSRQMPTIANWNQSTGISSYGNDTLYTVDGGAGGVEMLEWYENHTGPFWVFLSYDKYTNFGTNTAAHNHLAEYNQVIKMYFSNFDYTISKRGATNHDLWNITLSLEEV